MSIAALCRVAVDSAPFVATCGTTTAVWTFASPEGVVYTNPGQRPGFTESRF